MNYIFNINKRYLFNILTTIAVLLFTTSLNSSSGYLIILGFSIFYLSSKYNISKLNLLLLFSFSIFFLIYYVLMLPQFENNVVYRNNSIIMFFTGFTLVLFGKKEQYAFDSKHSFHYLDFLYFYYFSFLLFILIKFAITYIGNWGLRLYDRKTFPFGYHHVDFSILVILGFIFGIRRAHYISSGLLLILSWIILPARTSKLFFLCFAFFTLLLNIQELKKWLFYVLPKSVFSYFLISFLLTIVFAFLFVNVFPSFFVIQDNHEGLIDTSNTDRFKAFLYALQVIRYKQLFVQGILPSLAYPEIITSKYSVQNGPHNSILSIILYHSIMFGGLYIICIISWMKKICYNNLQRIILLSYVITSIIIHDMFVTQRFFAFFCLMSIPERNGDIRIINRMKI